MSLFTLFLPPLIATDISRLHTQYSTSQYCLQEYQEQHGWDKLSSQYQELCTQEELFNGNINDPELYTLAGWEYVHGADPTSINPETQPIGKYLLGLSILIFGTPIVMQYISLTIILIFTYLISRRIMSKWLAIIPSLFILSDQLFTTQLIDPYLDLTTTALILIYLYFFRRPKLAMVMLGLVALSKSFSLGIILALTSSIYLLITDRSKISRYLRLSWISILTYLTGYTMFFVYGHNLLDFAQLHLNIIRLYKSYVPEYPLGEVFRIIFVGQWQEWYGDFSLIKVNDWSFLWPISLAVSFLALFIKKFRANKTILLHLTWIIIYLSFISFRLVFPRYLLPILPSMYIVLTYCLGKVFVH